MLFLPHHFLTKPKEQIFGHFIWDHTKPSPYSLTPQSWLQVCVLICKSEMHLTTLSFAAKVTILP